MSASSAGISSARLDLGQESEPAEIDAEDRSVGRRVRDGAGRPEQRAVAAEGDDHVGVAGRARRAGRSASGSPMPRAARALFFDDGRAAVGAEPGGGIRERRQGVGQGVTRDERGGANGHASRLSSRRNSRLPSAPGDRRRFDGKTFQSYLKRCGRHVVDHARVHGRIAHDAALADFAPARLELRLDQRDDPPVRA